MLQEVWRKIDQSLLFEMEKAEFVVIKLIELNNEVFNWNIGRARLTLVHLSVSPLSFLAGFLLITLIICLLIASFSSTSLFLSPIPVHFVVESLRSLLDIESWRRV